MKNLKQLVLPCYKRGGNECGSMVFPDGLPTVCNLTYFLSFLSGMVVTEVK